MTALEIPETGLALRPGDQPGDAAAKPAQFMRLNLAQNTLDELISSLRSDDSTAKVRLGKHPTLHYGNKTQSFHAYPETHRSEIYHTSNDKHNLYFTGVLSHSLEVEKAREATAATDQALANLEESLNAFERGKASKSTHMIQHPDELKALRAKNSGSAMHRKDFFIRNANNRSLTSSPTLGAPKSPLSGMTPTSAPSSQTKTNARLQALKTPLIHLLAIRPVSTKFLARQTRSTIEECTALVQKYGAENRIAREKYDLKDKFYKDLDVWKFPYPTQDDRQAAIDKAISAFDRMRISRSDKLWQGLLPKDERGKGKCLSKLNLQSGLAGKKSATPRMGMDGADDRKDGDTTGNETDRPKAATTTVVMKSGTPAATAKARAEKEPAKRPAKNKNTNSTLTGRITKKTGGRPPAKATAEGKYKSAEFVHDSDESDDEIPDAPSPPAPARAPSPAPAAVRPAADRPNSAKATTVKKTSQPLPKKSTPVPTKPRQKEEASAAPTPKLPKAEAPTLKVEATKTAAKRPPSARPSTSPQKPSPLSSPPASASDATGRSRSDSHNQSSSSSSSSPLISQLGRAKAAGAVSALSNSTRPAHSTSKGAPAAINPLKRKAEPERPAASTPMGARATTGSNDPKRRRAVSTSSGGSTGSASPPMSHKVAQRRLWDKSQNFKKYYAKYRTLHESLAAQANPRPEQIKKLEGWHERLTQLKSEIWEEDRKLRDGSYS